MSKSFFWREFGPPLVATAVALAAISAMLLGAMWWQEGRAEEWRRHMASHRCWVTEEVDVPAHAQSAGKSVISVPAGVQTSWACDDGSTRTLWSRKP